MQIPSQHGTSWLILYLQEGMQMLFNLQNIFMTLVMIICFILHLMKVKLVLQNHLWAKASSLGPRADDSAAMVYEHLKKFSCSDVSGIKTSAD